MCQTTQYIENSMFEVSELGFFWIRAHDSSPWPSKPIIVL